MLHVIWDVMLYFALSSCFPGARDNGWLVGFMANILWYAARDGDNSRDNYHKSKRADASREFSIAINVYSLCKVYTLHIQSMK